MHDTFDKWRANETTILIKVPSWKLKIDFAIETKVSHLAIKCIHTHNNRFFVRRNERENDCGNWQLSIHTECHSVRYPLCAQDFCRCSLCNIIITYAKYKWRWCSCLWNGRHGTQHQPEWWYMEVWWGPFCSRRLCSMSLLHRSFRFFSLHFAHAEGNPTTNRAIWLCRANGDDDANANFMTVSKIRSSLFSFWKADVESQKPFFPSRARPLSLSFSVYRSLARWRVQN